MTSSVQIMRGKVLKISKPFSFLLIASTSKHRRTKVIFDHISFPKYNVTSTPSLLKVTAIKWSKPLNNQYVCVWFQIFGTWARFRWWAFWLSCEKRSPNTEGSSTLFPSNYISIGFLPFTLDLPPWFEGEIGLISQSISNRPCLIAARKFTVRRQEQYQNCWFRDGVSSADGLHVGNIMWFTSLCMSWSYSSMFDSLNC